MNIIAVNLARFQKGRQSSHDDENGHGQKKKETYSFMLGDKRLCEMGGEESTIQKKLPFSQGDPKRDNPAMMTKTATARTKRDPQLYVEEAI